MCKQEFLFQKIDLHAQQKIYFHVMQAQGEAQAVQSSGVGNY